MRNYDWHHRNTKDKWLLQETIFMPVNRQSRRNGQILRNVYSPNTEPGRNRK